MAHMIEGNSCMFVRQPAWHGLGVVLDRPPTSAEAIKAAGMDWSVLRRQLYWVPEDAGLIERLKKQEVPNRFALVRGTDERFLSVVSGDYEALQNTEAFGFFDPIVREGLATYESAGVMCEGRKVWILARVSKPMVVGRDELRPYLLLCNGHDGQTRVLVQPTPIRVVCNNTLQMSLAHGLVYSFRHLTGIAQKIAITRDQLIGVLGSFEGLQDELTALAKKQLGADEIVAYIDEVLDIKAESPEAPYGLVQPGDTLVPDEHDDHEERVDRALQNRRNARAKILELHEAGQGPRPGTLWGAYNAIVEFVEYYAGKAAKDRGNYQIFGAGATLKIKALDAAKRLAGLPV